MAINTDGNRVKIFVFGSNTTGRHGAGAALIARRQYGAIYGCGEGLQGYSYAIPTKDQNLERRSLDEIKQSVDTFLAFARETPEIIYQVTRIGCGLARFRDDEIGPMFKGAPANCELPKNWECYR